jgi:ATP:ADP antiporter, AAA family
MRKSEPDYLVPTAVVSAASMIAFQVAGKATRDALFLSNFPLESLPAVVAASAGVAIVAVFGASRLLSTKGPGAVIPYAFGASAVLLLAEWLFYGFSPRTTAVVFYFHMAGFGAILISGFWSIISELFDPRTAKAQIGRIAGAGTLGGLIGGVIAERIGTVFSIYSMLPVLAVLHLFCALLNHRLRAPMGAIASRPATGETEAIVKSGIAVLRSETYLKLLALLVMLGTVGETLLDYVLKDRAVETFSQGQQLIRFFAVFYTGTSLVTFMVQAGFSRYFLKQFGVARTISTMPLLVAGGGLGSLVWPGLLSVSLLRGFQSVLRSSLFRSGYEVLFAPVSPVEKRAAKTIVDVSFDKLGDAIGAGIIRLVLLVGLSALANSRLLTFIAVLLGALSLLLTFRLGRGYVSTLEKSLLNQAANLDTIDFEERTTRATMLRTLGTVELGAVRNLLSVEKRQPVKEFAGMDAVTKQFSELQSESSDVVRAALARPEPLDPLLVAAAIRLLARDDVSEDAVKALRKCVEATVGQMTDALLNAEEDFAVRRRIPRVLAYSVSSRAVEGLTQGLYDSRFEVRFSCGRGLSKIGAMDPRLPMPVESIYTAIRKEMETARRLSEMPRVIDRYEDPGEPITGKTSWKSTDVRLEHIFRLLSLNLPREPLQISFQALHTNDTYLRGTALEYLESVLPAGIRESLLEFLEGSFQPSASPRTVDHLTNELMRSRHQIELKVSQTPGEPLRKRL